MPNPISTSEAASRTGIPKRTIIAAITRGDLPASKMAGLTGAYLIREDDLDEWQTKRATA